LPPGDPGRPRKPAKKRPASIRDAAATAAGSAPKPSGSAAGRGGAGPKPTRPPAAKLPEGPPGPQPPAFPDFDTPSTGWDPWDQTIEGPPGDEQAFDPNRTLGDWLEAVIPAEAQVHFIRAGQEFAAGVQTTVDHHLGRREPDGGADGATRIEIE
jgi:hypothetical protein